MQFLRSTLWIVMVILIESLYSATGSDNPVIQVDEKGNVKLRIDFEAGVHIANTPPVVVRPLKDTTILTTDTLFTLFNVDTMFDDEEHRGRLVYSIASSDSSVVIPVIDSVTGKILGRYESFSSGTCTITVVASDRIDSVQTSSTITLQEPLRWTKSLGKVNLKRDAVTSVDMTKQFNSERYSSFTLEAKSEIPDLVAVRDSSGILLLESSKVMSGETSVIITVSNNESQTIIGTLSVRVRDPYVFNPVLGLEGGNVSWGVSSGMLLNSFFEIEGVWRTSWDFHTFAADGRVSFYPLRFENHTSISFFMGGGYEKTAVAQFIESSDAEQTIELWTVHGGMGYGITLGNRRNHSVRLNITYFYGEKEYSRYSLVSDRLMNSSYATEPLRFNLCYTFILGKTKYEQSLTGK